MFNLFNKKKINLSEADKQIMSLGFINKKRYLKWITEYEQDYQKDMAILKSLPPDDQRTPEEKELFKEISTRFVDVYVPNYFAFIKFKK